MDEYQSHFTEWKEENSGDYIYVISIKIKEQQYIV